MMALAAGRRSSIAASVIKGILLEEAVASLISSAGYRLLTVPADDPHDLHWLGNGLQVRGRGGFHQVDVLGELSWVPAFGNPIRLFIEAKWRERRTSTVGIRDARHAVGIVLDVNQVLTTVGAPTPGGADRDGDDVTARGRSFCYDYRYALCSVSGFSKGAQAFALAHQVSLLDLSNRAFAPLVSAINQAGYHLHSRLDASVRGSESGSQSDPSRVRTNVVRRIRETMRSALWEGGSSAADSMFATVLSPLVNEVRRVGELFVGVSATGFVILLKANDPQAFVRCMRGRTDPHVQAFWDVDEPLDWELEVSGGEWHPRCRLSFRLPEILLRSFEAREERGRPAAALDFKVEHFSRITVYRISDDSTLVCTLRLDRSWLSRARRAIEKR